MSSSQGVLHILYAFFKYSDLISHTYTHTHTHVHTQHTERAPTGTSRQTHTKITNIKTIWCVCIVIICTTICVFLKLLTCRTHVCRYFFSKFTQHSKLQKTHSTGTSFPKWLNKLEKQQKMILKMIFADIISTMIIVDRGFATPLFYDNHPCIGYPHLFQISSTPISPKMHVKMISDIENNICRL